MPRAAVFENHIKNFGGNSIIEHSYPIRDNVPYADGRGYRSEPILLPAITGTGAVYRTVPNIRRSRSPSPAEEDKAEYGRELRRQMMEERERREAEKHPWRVGRDRGWLASLSPTKADEERMMRLQDGRKSPGIEEAASLTNTRTSLPPGPQDSPSRDTMEHTMPHQGPKEWDFVPPEMRPGFLPSIQKDEGLWMIGSQADERNKMQLSKLQYGQELLEQARQQRLKRENSIKRRKWGTPPDGGWGHERMGRDSSIVRQAPDARGHASPSPQDIYRAQLDAQVREKRDREEEARRRGGGEWRGGDGGGGTPNRRDRSPQDIYRAQLDAQVREKRDREEEARRRGGGDWGVGRGGETLKRRDRSPQDIYRAQLDAQVREKQDRLAGEREREGRAAERQSGGGPRDLSPQEIYKAQLDAQIREKQDRLAEERRREREREEREREREARDADYNPWGRAGAGAPLRTADGKIVSDFRREGVRGISYQGHDSQQTTPSHARAFPPPDSEERGARGGRSRTLSIAVETSEELLSEVMGLTSEIRNMGACRNLAVDSWDVDDRPVLLQPMQDLPIRASGPSPKQAAKVPKTDIFLLQKKREEEEREERERRAFEERASLKEIIEQQQALRDQLVRQSRLMATLEQSLIASPPANENAKQVLVKYAAVLQKDDPTGLWAPDFGMPPGLTPRMHHTPRRDWGRDGDDDLPPAIIRSEERFEGYGYETPRPPSVGLSMGVQRARQRAHVMEYEIAEPKRAIIPATPPRVVQTAIDLPPVKAATPLVVILPEAPAHVKEAEKLLDRADAKLKELEPSQPSASRGPAPYTYQPASLQDRMGMSLEEAIPEAVRLSHAKVREAAEVVKLAREAVSLATGQ